MRIFDSRLSEAQAGFRKGRGYADQIYAVPRIRQSKVCQEYFVSKKLCRLLQTLFTSTKSAVRLDGELTELFDVNIDHVLRRYLDQLENEERMMWRDELESKRNRVRLEYRLPDGRRV